MRGIDFKYINDNANSNNMLYIGVLKKKNKNKKKKKKNVCKWGPSLSKRFLHDIFT